MWTLILVDLLVGCDALSDEAGSERGPTQRDQAGAAKLREAQGETVVLAEVTPMFERVLTACV